MCHCLECQRRTGAVISNQARFPREQITFAGEAKAWRRTAESGKGLTFHFCPTCGSTVYWEGEGFPGYVAVAVGNFADPDFPAPTIGVWEESIRRLTIRSCSYRNALPRQRRAAARPAGKLFIQTRKHVAVGIALASRGRFKHSIGATAHSHIPPAVLGGVCL
jgi:hypothetical protein